MIKVEKTDIWGFEHAIRGMRNPMNSWDRSDSYLHEFFSDNKAYGVGSIGKNDLGLMVKLYEAGPEHRKYLRQIFVSMDITAPLYWWKEFDTYKVGTVANSCSTMHKIQAKEFDIDDFSHEHLSDENLEFMDILIDRLNRERKSFNLSKNKQNWWQLIQMLPSSYNQKRTVTFNYENVISMIRQRKNHKLDEWHVFCDILKDLPYVEEITESGESNYESSAEEV